MATAMDETYFRENGHNATNALVLNSPTTSKKTDVDEVPDYNEAFPQLRSAGQGDVNRSSTFFSTPFPSSSANGNNSTGAMGNTTTAMHSAAKTEEGWRRTMAMHASSTTTKIVSDALLRNMRFSRSLTRLTARENICFHLLRKSYSIVLLSLSCALTKQVHLKGRTTVT
jgi:hypothetical protein